MLVWAGMRGAVTLAAAQTLPDETPHRSLLILIAFVVAAGSLLLQGGTLPWVVRALGVGASGPPENDPERADLLQTLSQAAVALRRRPDARAPGRHAVQPTPAGRHADGVACAGPRTSRPRSRAPISDQMLELQLAVIKAQREALLQARSDGTFSSGTLSSALAILDADQISAELKGAPSRRG